MKMTEANVKRITLPAGKKEAIVFDDNGNGLALRLRVGGSRKWIVQYRIGDQQRRQTLENGALDLKGARSAASLIHSKLNLGIDPVAEKKANKAKAEAEKINATNSLGRATDRFLELQAGRLRPNSMKQARRYLGVLFKPLHALPLASITRTHIASRLEKIAAENGATSADRARATLSGFFTWAMRQGLAEANPVTATPLHAEEKPRERTLSDAELGRIWKGLGEDHFGDIGRLLILTGQRRDEIAWLRWSEINPETRVIALPATRTKNKRQHDVPLSDAAWEVLERQPRRAGRDLIFGEGQGGFSGFSKAKPVLDQKLAEMPEWRIHDLRRTAVTGMADKGVQPHIVEAVVNHVSGHKAGVAGVYNKAAYAQEKRAALDLWADHVMAVVEGRKSNVVSINAKRQLST